MSWRSVATGTGFGLVAGAVGIVHWMLTQRDLAARLAAFQALYRHYPPGVYRDATNVVRGNEWYWFGTALLPAAVLLAVVWLAALTAGWVWQLERDGKLAGFVAAVVGGGLYIAATIVAIVTSPEPDMTESITGCEFVWAIALIVSVRFLARGGARLGVRARQTRSRNRTAS